MSHLIMYLIIALLVVILAVLFIVRARKNMPGQEAQHYPENEQLYVGNLPYQMSYHQLKNLFSEYGEVTMARVVKDARTGRSKGFAFVTFAQTEEAKNALQANGKMIQGRSIVVRMAKPRTE